MGALHNVQRVQSPAWVSRPSCSTTSRSCWGGYSLLRLRTLSRCGKRCAASPRGKQLRHIVRIVSVVSQQAQHSRQPPQHPVGSKANLSGAHRDPRHSVVEKSRVEESSDCRLAIEEAWWGIAPLSIGNSRTPRLLRKAAEPQTLNAGLRFLLLDFSTPEKG